MTEPIDGRVPVTLVVGMHSCNITGNIDGYTLGLVFDGIKYYFRSQPIKEIVGGTERDRINVVTDRALLAAKIVKHDLESRGMRVVITNIDVIKLREEKDKLEHRIRSIDHTLGEIKE